MRTDAGKRVLPDCINAGNPYHECVDFCSLRIAADKAAAAAAAAARLEDERLKAPPAERTVHPDCPNAANPYHECGDDCFRKIIEARERIKEGQLGVQPEDGAPDGFEKSEVPLDDKEPGQMGQNDASTDNDKIPVQTGQSDGNDVQHVQNDTEADYPILNERQKKLRELSLKMSEARKANQTAMVAEKKKMEAPTESRGVSKQTWIEDRKKKIGKLLDSNGLDMSKAYMLDTQDQAQAKYKKWEKDPAPSGWEVFNQKTLYNAYKKRTKNVHCDMEAYNKAKEADPEFYRDAASLQYGKATKTPDENINRMVKELEDTKKRREAFSRRRKFHEEKDVDSINDRNEHFNKKIERAFGKYTLEIKNNLERGTSPPD